MKQQDLIISMIIPGKNVAEVHLLINYTQIENEDFKKLNLNMKKLDKEIEKIRVENENLRKELKVVNDKLNKAIERNKPKKVMNNNETNEEQMRLEIQNADKMIEIYQKELNSQMNSEHNPEGLSVQKLIELQSNYSLKLRTKADIMIEIRQLTKVNREHQKLLNTMEISQDMKKQVELLSNDVENQTQKFKQLQKIARITEKNRKEVEEFFEVLELKYKSICDQYQLKANLLYFLKEVDTDKIQKEKEEKEQMLRKIERTRNIKDILSYDKDIEETNLVEGIISEKTIIELRNKLKQYKRLVKGFEGKAKNEIQSAQQRLISTEFDVKKTQYNIKEKEKEIVIAQQRNSEMQKSIKHQVLVPINYQESLLKQAYEECKKLLTKACLRNSLFRNTKRYAGGGLFTQNVIEFDDLLILVLDEKETYILVQLDVFHDGKELIYGLQASYLATQTNQLIKGFNNLDYKLLQTAQKSSLQFEQNEWIKSVSGQATESIDYLKIETTKGQVLSLGIMNQKEKPVQFCINADVTQIPMIIFGGLDFKINMILLDKSDDMVLVYIGLEMRNLYLHQPLIRSKSKTKPKIEEPQSAEKQSGPENFLRKKQSYILRQRNLQNSLSSGKIQPNNQSKSMRMPLINSEKKTDCLVTEVKNEFKKQNVTVKQF